MNISEFVRLEADSDVMISFSGCSELGSDLGFFLRTHRAPMN